jgi:pimeloyl-ACP methyl ester carboxylesterase
MAVLPVDGTPIHYLERGASPPTLCLVHGAGGSTVSWAPQLEGLADAARVLALDLPGHGGSGGPGRAGIEAYAAILTGFVEALGAGPLVLGGHSMGGAVVQSVALARPDLVAGLLLVGTGARLRVLPRILELLESDYPEGCALVNALGFAEASPAALKASARAAMLGTPPAVTLGDFRACDAFDILDRVAAIRAPTLVVTGEEDRLTPVKYARFLAGRIARARLALVEGAGHYVQLEQPERVNALIRAFLAERGA